MMPHLQTHTHGQLPVNEWPDHCPICHYSIQASAFATGIVVKNTIEQIFCCPRAACARLFVARFRLVNNSALWTLFETYPNNFVPSSVSPVVSAISQDFVSIFAEAESADHLGLKLICGPGYRKALEFLIKDYVVKGHPTEAEKITHMNLAKCIADYVSDDKVKKVAARAVWLGNDETHYMRKWEDKDLSDLKGLIRLTMHWMEMSEMTENILRDMAEGK